MERKHRTVIAAQVAVTLLAAACGTEGTDTNALSLGPVGTLTAKPTGTVADLDGGPTTAAPLPPCTPAPPINPRRCSPEEPPPAPPVPPGGICTIEVLADSLTFSNGQGFTEGKAEASVLFVLTDLRTGAITSRRYPEVGSYKMKKGKERTLGGKLAEYEVPETKRLDVEVCATFREHDGEVIDINGDDDVGTDCETVALTCPQPSASAGMSASLCKGGDCSKINGAMSADVKVMAADADLDCVENEDDYTPEPCDEAFKGQLCRGSLVYFYYGDGPITTLAQHIGTDLNKEMTGYDRTVLLIDQLQVGPFGVDPAALNLADVVMEPSEQAFFAALQDLTARGCDIDVWIHSHGNPDWDIQPDLSVIVGGGVIEAIDDDEHGPGDDANITTKELAEDTDPLNSGTAAVPVRMTYGVACFYELWNQTWRDAGAITTVGSLGINFVPMFSGNFADHWNTAATFGASVAAEYSAFDEGVAFAFIESQGLVGPWWCVGNSVLGNNACAEDFFIDGDALPIGTAAGTIINGPDSSEYSIGGPLWDTAGVAYDTNATGIDNMRAESVKVLAGDVTVRKNVPPTLTWP